MSDQFNLFDKQLLKTKDCKDKAFSQEVHLLCLRIYVG